MHIAPIAFTSAFAFVAGTLAMLATCCLIAFLIYAFVSIQRRDL